jgi:hypothetical protein
MTDSDPDRNSGMREVRLSMLARELGVDPLILRQQLQSARYRPVPEGDPTLRLGDVLLQRLRRRLGRRDSR